MKVLKLITLILLLSQLTFVNYISGTTIPPNQESNNSIGNIIDNQLLTLNQNPIVVSLKSNIIQINTITWLIINVSNPLTETSNIIIQLKSDSATLQFNSTDYHEFSFELLQVGPQETISKSISIKGQLKKNLILGTQTFNVTGYFEEINPINRIAETLDLSLTVFSHQSQRLFETNNIDFSSVNYGHYEYTVNGVENILYYTLKTLMNVIIILSLMLILLIV